MAADRSKLERSLDDANRMIRALEVIPIVSRSRKEQRELDAAYTRARAARNALRQHRNRMEGR